MLVFRHVLFQNGVTIPAAFLIHDRKNQQTHDDFFRIIAEAVPNLKKGSHVIVMDREKVFTNAINKYLPNIKQVFCWNHLRRDLRHWLSTSTTNATSDDKSEYGHTVYHPSTTHNYCMIPPNVKKFNSNPSPISLLCLAVLTQSAYNLGQGGGGGGYSHFF